MYESRESKRKKEIKEWIMSIIIVVVVVTIVRGFLIGTVIVKGISMEPTFEHNDFVIINKLGSPKRGDIVTCSYDKGTHEENLIKRVIGLPGDIIDIDTGEDYEYIVIVNGETIEESYLAEKMEQKGDIDYPYTVPEGCYFVMGDNRNKSNDSRDKTIGAIEKENIHGKVFFRLHPFEKITLF